MRQDPDGTIVLSKRNLLALLHKLEMPNSKRTLIAPQGFAVKVETDEEHYVSRPAPGPMHPDTEAFIRHQGELKERH